MGRVVCLDPVAARSLVIRADSFIETLQKMIGGLKRGLGECVTKDMQCFLEPERERGVFIRINS